MSFLLYKQAAMDTQTKHQIAGAVGGGALGYLLTRYGLGLKGAGAGLAGAGFGAAAGAAGGSYLAGYGKSREEQVKRDKAKMGELKEKVDEPVTQTFKRNAKDPLSLGIAASFGGWRAAHSKGAIKEDLGRRARALASHFLTAADDNAADELGRTYRGAIDEDLSAAIREQITKQMPRGRAAGRATRVVNAAMAGGAPPSGTMRKNIVRARRGAGNFLAAALLLPLLQTAAEKKIYNPRRREALKMEGM